VTITTGLVDGYSTPTLLNLIRTGQPRRRPVRHAPVALDDFQEAYDTFARTNDTGALKVVVSRA
jgi:alcohol dehydrogenase